MKKVFDDDREDIVRASPEKTKKAPKKEAPKKVEKKKEVPKKERMPEPEIPEIKEAVEE